MKRILTLVFFGTAAFLSSCNKEPERETRFTITGNKTVSYDSGDSSNTMELTVMELDPNQLPVDLSVEGLPSDYTAEIRPTSGVPPFKSRITIRKTGSGNESGTFEYRLVAKSSSFTLTLPMYLGVPKNGFRINMTDTIHLSKAAYAYVHVERTHGPAPEQANLYVAELPYNMSAVIEDRIGIPTYHPFVSFQEGTILSEGYYPIRMVAVTEEFRYEHRAIIHVDKWSGYTVDDMPFRSRMTAGTEIKLDNVQNEKAGTNLRIIPHGFSLPTAEGTYTYPAGGPGGGQYLEIIHELVQQSQTVSYQTENTAGPNAVTLTVSGGKYRVRAGAITLREPNLGGSERITIDAAQ